MESTQKTENRKAARSSERKSTENDSEEELQPPSPIHIAPEAAMVPDFDFADPQELRRIESDTQSRLKAILEVAGVTGLSQIDARTFQDPEILRKLTNRLVYSDGHVVVIWMGTAWKHMSPGFSYILNRKFDVASALLSWVLHVGL